MRSPPRGPQTGGDLSPHLFHLLDLLLKPLEFSVQHFAYAMAGRLPGVFQPENLSDFLEAESQSLGILDELDPLQCFGRVHTISPACPLRLLNKTDGK
jgi:hypothetical protein